MKQNSDLILASASPRRAELLSQIGIRYTVIVCDIDENCLDDESPVQHVSRLAREKAAAGREMSAALLPVLGADTIVLLDGEILGKPVDQDQAQQMLRRLSGRTHQVLSAVSVLDPGGSIHEDLNASAVTFADIPSAFIQSYCRSAEPMDKAGAYAVQGMTARYITRLDGSYSGVMGLPLFETGRLLQAAGVIE
ncbi:MAG: septum formation inhibitor Maf [Xanthomonadales bacterium]|nr:septum formation inhibitor Maf [Xanthomonadales bacterium]NNL95462.1 septum formation inhibitor Maf [Xanthomonadales bacterium]